MYFFLFHLLLFLLMRLIILKDLLTDCGFTFVKHASEITEFWPLSLQPAELYYILLVYFCLMDNSCSRSLHIIAFLSQS